MTEKPQVEILRAAAEKLRAGVAHCAPEAHDYHAPDGHGIAVLRPELATALAAWLDDAVRGWGYGPPHQAKLAVAVAGALLGEVQS